MKLEQAVEELRRCILQLVPAGSGSFEDLVAGALEEITGYGFRLMPTGRQDGGDAVSRVDGNLIVVEAKRYDKQKGLRQALIGKIIELEGGRRGKPDIWIAAVTCALGGDDKGEIETTAERVDIPAIVCDWSGKLPDLAVLLTMGRRKTLPFLNRSLSRPNVSISALFDKIENDTDYPARRDRLNEEIIFQAQAFRTFLNDSISTNEAAMAGRTLARQRYGQVLTPLRSDPRGVPGGDVLERREVLDELDRRFLSAERDELPLVVLGEEGVGKSWVVADWWVRRRHRRDAFVFINAASVRNQSDKIEGLLANALFDLLDRKRQQSRQASDRWRHRISSAGFKRQARRRIIVIVDGLNEEPWLEWGPRILPALLEACGEYGATMIVTCRPVFWYRHVAPYLEIPRQQGWSILHVKGFTTEEQDAFLRLRGTSRDSLSPRLLSTAVNPRALSLAADLIERFEHSADLTATPIGGLGLDVMLLNYWDYRRRERSHLWRPGNAEFLMALADIAKTIWSNERRRSGNARTEDNHQPHKVSLREWVARIAGGDVETERLVGELSEGIFFAEHNSAIDPRVLLSEKAQTFCIGLYLYGFLLEKKAEIQSVADLREWFDSEIDPVRDFDRTSEHLLAALTVACLDHGNDDVVVAVLADALSRLRNRRDGLYPEFAYLVRKRVAAFCDARQWLLDATPAATEADWITSTLKACTAVDGTWSSDLRKRLSDWIAGGASSRIWHEERPVFLLDGHHLGLADLRELAMFVIGRSDLSPYVQPLRTYAALSVEQDTGLDGVVADRILMDLGGGMFEAALIAAVEGEPARSPNGIAGDALLFSSLATPSAARCVAGGARMLPTSRSDPTTVALNAPTPSGVVALEINGAEASRFRLELLAWARDDPSVLRARVVSALTGVSGTMLTTRLVVAGETSPTLLAALGDLNIVRRALEIASKALADRGNAQDERYALLLACALHACFVSCGEQDELFASFLNENTLARSYAELVEGVGLNVRWAVPLSGRATRTLLDGIVSSPETASGIDGSASQAVARLLGHERLDLSPELQDWIIEAFDNPNLDESVVQVLLETAAQPRMRGLASRLMKIDMSPWLSAPGVLSSLAHIQILACDGQLPADFRLDDIGREELPLLLSSVADEHLATVVEALDEAITKAIASTSRIDQRAGDANRNSTSFAPASRAGAQRLWRCFEVLVESWFVKSSGEGRNQTTKRLLVSLIDALDRPRSVCDLYLASDWRLMHDRGSTFPKIGLAASSAFRLADVDQQFGVQRFDAIILALARNDAAFEGLVDLILEKPERRRLVASWIALASACGDGLRLANAIRLAACLNLAGPELDLPQDGFLGQVVQAARNLRSKSSRLEELWRDWTTAADPFRAAMTELAMFEAGVVRKIKDLSATSSAAQLLQAAIMRSRAEVEKSSAKQFFGFREPPIAWLFPERDNLMPGERLALGTLK